MFKIKENDLFSKNMSGSELYKTTKLGKKYTQKPAEIPGGMVLEMMKDVEDEIRVIEDNLKHGVIQQEELINQYIRSKQEYDKWLNELITKNGTIKY